MRIRVPAGFWSSVAIAIAVAAGVVAALWIDGTIR